jgi:hypothetical protein
MRGPISRLIDPLATPGMAWRCSSERVGCGGGLPGGAVSTRGGGCPLRGADAILTALGAGQVYRAHKNTGGEEAAHGSINVTSLIALGKEGGGLWAKQKSSMLG